VAEGITATVQLMAASGLPCYGRGKPVDNLRARFKLDLTDAQARGMLQTLQAMVQPARPRHSNPSIKFSIECLWTIFLHRSLCSSLRHGRVSETALRLSAPGPQAAAFMRKEVQNAYNKWTTGFYDYVQVSLHRSCGVICQNLNRFATLTIRASVLYYFCAEHAPQSAFAAGPPATALTTVDILTVEQVIDSVVVSMLCSTSKTPFQSEAAGWGSQRSRAKGT